MFANGIKCKLYKEQLWNYTMENRTENVGVRMTPKELKDITHISNRFGMKVPQYIRWTLFYKMKDVEGE